MKFEIKTVEITANAVETHIFIKECLSTAHLIISRIDFSNFLVFFFIIINILSV